MTLGSLATVAVRPNAGRRPFPAFAAIAIGVGVSLGYFGWTHPDLVDDRLPRAALSRVSLPGDPVLGSDLEDATVGHEWSAIQMLLRVDSTGLVSPSATDTQEHAEPSLSPQEIRRRTKNYQAWLSDHGMRRLEDLERVDAPSSPATPSNDDDPLQRQQVAE
jgi:hypothetical protein